MTNPIIEPAVWDRAGWEGVALGHNTNPESAPFMALLYRHYEVGKEIFRHMQKVVGKINNSNILQVSIVEGDIPNTEDGYSIVIGPSVDKSPAISPDGTKEIISRVHRMNPDPNSKNLEIFKKFYAKYGSFKMMPAHYNGATVLFEESLGIELYNLRLLHVDSIGPNDIEQCVFIQSLRR